MIKRVYIAARFGRREFIQASVCSIVERAGFSVTSRWHRHPDDGELEGAMTCLQDMDSSDAVLLVTDPLGSKNSGGGRWFEAGYMFAMKKPIVVWGDREIIFLHIPSIFVANSLETAVRTLKSIQLK